MKSPIEKPFLSKTDIQKIFRCGYEKANYIFHRAKEIELSNDHIAVFEDKVPITCLMKATKLSLNVLKAQQELGGRGNG